MLTLVCLSLLLAGFFALVSSKHTPSSTTPTVYNDCLGDYSFPLPSGAASTSHFKPQGSVNTNEGDTGWEEWLVERWDPASVDLSNTTFSAWAYFPNGTFYNRRVYDAFEYEEAEGGGFTCSIANNGFTWDPVQGSWRISVNVEDLIIETHVKVVEPGLPFAPNYKSVSGQIADRLFSRMDIPRAHMTGYMVFPSDHNITLDRGIGTLKHTWSHKPMDDSLSAYVRGTGLIPDPPATVNRYQAWDLFGNEIDSMQLLQPGGPPGSQVFRIQITDDPEILSIVTTPTPTSLPLAHNNTEITLPMCGPGADFENTDQKMTWKVAGDRDLFEFVDSAGGVTLCGMGHSTTVLWVNGMSQESSNGRGFIEVYRRG